jgi:hypothetical protein
MGFKSLLHGCYFVGSSFLGIILPLQAALCAVAQQNYSLGSIFFFFFLINKKIKNKWSASLPRLGLHNSLSHLVPLPLYIMTCSVTTASYIRIKFSFKFAFNSVYKNISKKYMFN